VAFAAAHADGRPHRALPQKPKLESLNLGDIKYHTPVVKNRLERSGFKKPQITPKGFFCTDAKIAAERK
jgi:hypothetical protein